PWLPSGSMRSPERWARPAPTRRPWLAGGRASRSACGKRGADPAVWGRGRPGMARIGPVYTPDAARRRGYAAACVSWVSRELLEAGHGCVLYTDLANPTSNSVYRALGYRAIAELVR